MVYWWTVRGIYVDLDEYLTIGDHYHNLHRKLMEWIQMDIELSQLIDMWHEKEFLHKV